MFGYLTVDKGELKGRDFDRYREYYCGVCRDIRDACGEVARLTLTYDMTFLAILLTSLYEGADDETEVRCTLHPLRKTKVIRNPYTAYAADMNVILAYHDLDDNWIDDGNIPSYAASRAMRRAYLKTAAAYPRQVKAVRHYLRELHATEAEGCTDPEKAAGETGVLMSEIFCCRDDEWSNLLRETGFYLGKFIYLMDAWDDLEKDRKNNAYNPFIFSGNAAAGPDGRASRPGDSTVGPDGRASHPGDSTADTDKRAVRLMTMQASGAARAFEELPLLRDVDILRNILYSGIWIRYRSKRPDSDKKADSGLCPHHEMHTN